MSIHEDDDIEDPENEFTLTTDFSYLWKKPLGAPVLYSSSEQLWLDCIEYFKFCQDNPLWASETVRTKIGASRISVPKLRAYTITGLCAFLGITTQTWYTWEKERADLSDALSRATETIRTQKFEGAAVEMLNPGFIARDLGMVDRRDVTTKDRAIKDETDFSNLTEDELEQMASLSRKMKK